jgi:flagellar basal-body rod protein FlgB
MDLANRSVDRVLQGALGGLSTRQRVAANNVANAETPGFKVSRVLFEDALKQAVEGAGKSGENGAPADVTPRVITEGHTSRQLDGNNVDVDFEMLQLAETNITYNALTQAMAGRLRLLRSVISEGRR